MQTTYSQQIAAELRAEMARQGYKRRDLATLFGVSGVTASKMLNGSRGLSLDELDQIARWLGVETSTLVVRVEANA